MGDENEPAASGLRWDGTVTAGNVLTAMAMTLAMVVAFIRLEGRMEAQYDRIVRLEAARERDDRESAGLRESIGEVRAGVVHLQRQQDQILRMVTPPGGR